MHYTNYVILQLLCPKNTNVQFFFNKKSKFLNTDTYKMPPFSYKRKKIPTVHVPATLSGKEENPILNF